MANLLTTEERVEYSLDYLRNVQRMMETSPALRIGRSNILSTVFFYVLDGKVWRVDMDVGASVIREVNRWDYYEFCAQLREDAQSPDFRCLPSFTPLDGFSVPSPPPPRDDSIGLRDAISRLATIGRLMITNIGEASAAPDGVSLGTALSAYLGPEDCRQLVSTILARRGEALADVVLHRIWDSRVYRHGSVVVAGVPSNLLVGLEAFRPSGLTHPTTGELLRPLFPASGPDESRIPTRRPVPIPPVRRLTY